jgi:HemY protein
MTATRFVGIRGLMHQRLAAGDEETALKLAQKAFDLKPKHEETQDILLRLQAEHGDWKGARATLGAKLRHGGLPRDVFRRRDAVLALSEAKGVFEDGASIEAREAAIEANKAVARPDSRRGDGRARLHRRRRPKYATRVLKKAWEGDAASRPGRGLCRDRADRDRRRTG